MNFQTYAIEATGGGAHIDAPLGNLAIMAFDTGDANFVGEQILPAVNVGKESNKYYIIDKAAFLRIPNALRARSTEAGRVRFDTSSDSYFCENYALASDIPLEDLANADNPVQLRKNTTKLVVTNLRRAQEVRIAGLVTSITNIGSGVQLTGTNKWGDPNSDPIADVTTGHAFVADTTGLQANTMLMDKDTHAIVRRHPQLLDMFKYTSGGQVTDDQLKETFGVQKLLIARGVKENAVEQATSSITNIWGNNVLLAHIGPATGMQSQTFGLRFQWRNPLFPANFGVIRSVINAAGSKKVEVIEAGHFQDEKIVAGDLAYCIQNTL